MGLFNIFTRTTRRDELLGEIAPLLTQAKTLTFISDTSKNKLFTDIHALTNKLITNHGNDAAIVTPVKTILQTLGNQGVPTSHFVDIRSSAYNAYYDYKMHKKNDTGLLREIEKLIVARLDADKHFETLTTIQKTSPYALTRQECSRIILDLALIQSINGEHKNSLENIHLAFEYLRPKEQEKAINLIDANCLDMRARIKDFDAIYAYSDFIQYGIPKAVRYNMAHNFLSLYSPSEIDENTRREYVERAAQIYSYSEEPKLKNWAYQRIDELANLVAQEGDLDSSIDFRRNIMVRMTNSDPLLPTAIAAWDKDIEKLEYPSEKFYKSIGALHANKGLHFSYASPKLVNHILYTANSQLDGIRKEKSDESIRVAIDQLENECSFLNQLCPQSANNDLAATIIMNAYDKLDKKTPHYNDRRRIFHRTIELRKISPPTLHRIMNSWENAIVSEAKERPTVIPALLDNIESVIKKIQGDFYRNNRHDFVKHSNMINKLPMNQKIIFEGMLDNIVKISPFLSKSSDKKTAATLLIECSPKESAIYKNGIALYTEGYKEEKANNEQTFHSMNILPSPLPKELKILFASYAKQEKSDQTPKPSKAIPLSPSDFSNAFENRLW